MRKKAGIILLVFSCILVIYLLGFSNKVSRLSDMVINEDELQQIIESRERSQGVLLESLCFDEQTLVMDVTNKTFYYSIVEGSASAYNPWVEKKVVNDTVSLAFVDAEIMQETIKNNVTYKIIAYDAAFYDEYYLKCTTLPIMNITCDTDIDIQDVPMSVALFDNRQGATQKVTTSQGTIHVRGGSTQIYPKKAYKLSLTQESLGDNIRNNKVALLGMRQDDDWILYPAYNDQEKIRNVFSSNLWKYTCAKDNSFGIDNGMEYKYIELFLNGEYWGLYALGYPIDELQLEIDGAQQEHLYKKRTWESEVFITPENDTAVTGYTTTESEKDDWLPLKQYYTLLHTDWKNSESMYSGIDIDNAIDMYLFVNLIQGLDHVGALGTASIKNMYLSIKYIDNKEVMLYTPWDMDITWGNKWTGDAQTNLTEAYGIEADVNTVMEHGNLYALVQNKDKEIWNLVLSKYWKLREKLWSEEYINTMLDEYEEDIYDSGAYLRERERWPNGSYSNEEQGLDRFRAYVMDRLQEADKYYTKLEELSEESIYIIRSAQYKKFKESQFIVEINNMEVLQDSDYRDFLMYIGVDIDAITNNTRFVLINGSKQQIEYLETLGENRTDTCIGVVELQEIEDKTDEYKICVDGKEWYTAQVNSVKDIQVKFMSEGEAKTFDFTKEYIMWSYLIEQQEPSKWCELIKKSGYNVVIEVINHNVISEEKFLELAKGFGIEAEKLSLNTDFLVVKEGAEKATVLENSHNSGDRFETVIGQLSIFYNEEGGYGVYLNDKDCIVAWPEDNESVDARIAVVEPDTFEIIWSFDVSY